MHPAYAHLVYMYKNQNIPGVHAFTKIMTKAHLIKGGGGGGQGVALICLCMWSQKPPETVSEINFKTFTQTPPLFVYLLSCYKIPSAINLGNL